MNFFLLESLNIYFKYVALLTVSNKYIGSVKVIYINEFKTDTNKPVSIFNTDNKYGYVLNVNHPTINELYNRYKLWKGFAASFPLSDEQRFEFESFILQTKTFETLLNSPPF